MLICRALPPHPPKPPLTPFAAKAARSEIDLVWGGNWGGFLRHSLRCACDRRNQRLCAPGLVRPMPALYPWFPLGVLRASFVGAPGFRLACGGANSGAGGWAAALAPLRWLRQSAPAFARAIAPLVKGAAMALAFSRLLSSARSRPFGVWCAPHFFFPLRGAAAPLGSRSLSASALPFAGGLRRAPLRSAARRSRSHLGCRGRRGFCAAAAALRRSLAPLRSRPAPAWRLRRAMNREYDGYMSKCCGNITVFG